MLLLRQLYILLLRDSLDCKGYWQIIIDIPIRFLYNISELCWLVQDWP